MTPQGYVLESEPEGRILVVTGRWSAEIADALAQGEADGLDLNYAHGFSGENLDFLDGSWGIRQLHLLHRGITDLTPLGRLGGSLQKLSLQAAPTAELDLGELPHLRSVNGEWVVLRDTLGRLDGLRKLFTWRFNEADLHAFRNHFALERLIVKDAPYLTSLSGIADLPALAILRVVGARRLSDISDVSGLGHSLEELELESSPRIGAIDHLEPLVNLRFLGISELGEIESLRPIRGMQRLEVFYRWGTTRIADGDLSPLAGLPHLREIRMMNRRGYTPTVDELMATFPT